MKGLVTGSFDPITLGHIDIIHRAKAMCDELVVVVFNNEEKSYMFSLTERMELVREALADMEGVSVDCSEGMVVDYCREHNIDLIIRGFRDYKDYDYEVNMAVYNYQHSGVQTELLYCTDEYQNISGSKARQKIINGEDLTGYLPKSIIERLRRV